MKIEGYWEGDSSVVQGYLKELQREFQGSSKVFQGCFKEVSMVFKESSYDASRKIKGCFNGVLTECQGC